MKTLLATIQGNKTEQAKVRQLAFRLATQAIEEVGELATGLSGDDEENKIEEFADVFAWLCTLANINGVDLEKACDKYIKGNITGYK